MVPPVRRKAISLLAFHQQDAAIFDNQVQSGFIDRCPCFIRVTPAGNVRLEVTSGPSAAVQTVSAKMPPAPDRGSIVPNINGHSRFPVSRPTARTMIYSSRVQVDIFQSHRTSESRATTSLCKLCPGAVAFSLEICWNSWYRNLWSQKSFQSRLGELLHTDLV